MTLPGLGVWRSSFGAGLWALAFLAAGCSSGPQAPEEDTRSYQQRIEEQRAAKDKFFRTSAPDNPIPASRQDELLPLLYYPVDAAYSVPAALELAEDQPVFDMPTSTGKMRKMTQIGMLKFTLKGQPMTLVAFAGEGPRGAPDMSRLFVPFSDSTSGTETYSAGRFLDLDRTATGVYVIDFNEAYSPYCAYNGSFECPYPPPANRLTVPVHAGERIKPEAAAATPPRG